MVNFLNRNNAADQRVFELLSDKFQLFEGVFGASDEVLGAIESRVDFEKRISCDLPVNAGKHDQIEAAFDQASDWSSTLKSTEFDEPDARSLLENFDDEVREKLQAFRINALAKILDVMSSTSWPSPDTSCVAMPNSLMMPRHLTG